MVSPGRTPTDQAVKKVLTRCLKDKLYVQSNLARELAVAIGIAASCGWITTKHGPLFGRQWLITSKGLKWLEETHECKAG